MENQLFDRLKGMIIGGALGDALGAPHEGLPPYKILGEKHGYYGKLCYSLKNSSVGINTPPDRFVGKWTDDTEMSFALISSLIKNKGYIKDSVIKEYIDFVNSYIRAGGCDLGRNTRFLFQDCRSLSEYYQRAQKMSKENESNGSLMRASPLAIFADQRIWTLDSMITNPANANIISNIIYLQMIRGALQGKNKTELYTEAVATANNCNVPEIKQLINSAKSDQKREVFDSMGWVLHALWCAVYALLHFDDYQSAIDNVILMGGDTDTNAKIAGDLLGAYYGFNKLIKMGNTAYNYKILVSANPVLDNIDNTIDLLMKIKTN